MDGEDYSYVLNIYVHIYSKINENRGYEFESEQEGMYGTVQGDKEKMK